MADGTMRCCGAPLKYARREANGAKNVTLVELGPKGDVRLWTRPLKPLREMRVARGAFDALMAAGPGAGMEDDYFFITLTDEEDVPNAAARLRQRFPRLLSLDYDNARTRAGGEGFLAFALGMSDAIQAGAVSAVRLDTMFVGEGFGSLSENCPGLVMDELNDTANTGRRLIGIISRVEEVKEGVGRRIERTKTASGVSKAEIR